MPTRGSYQLDHVFLNFDNSSDQPCKTFVNTISDHYTILYDIDIGYNIPSEVVTYRRRYTAERIASMGMALESETWNQVYSESDVDISFKHFTGIFSCYFDSFFPMTKTVVKNAGGIWCNSEIRESASKLKDLYILKHRYPQLSSHYISAKRRHIQLVRNAKRRYYQNFINNSDRPSTAAWKVVNTLTNKAKSHSNIVIEQNGTKKEDPFIVANEFNNFFKQAPIDILQKLELVGLTILGGLRRDVDLFLPPSFLVQ